MPVPVVSVRDARRQGAQRARRRRDRADAVHVGQIDVGEGDGAAVGEIADRGDQLGHAAGDVGRRHHRRVVGAGDGDA